MVPESNRFANQVNHRSPAARTWRHHPYDLKQFVTSGGCCSPPPTGASIFTLGLIDGPAPKLGGGAKVDRTGPGLLDSQGLR